MIKQLFSIVIALLLFSQILWAQWTPVGDRIKTSWAEKIDVNNVLPEYPRPIMERSEWFNLNGLWKYAVLPLGKSIPDSFEGDILVPLLLNPAFRESEEHWEKIKNYGISVSLLYLLNGEEKGFYFILELLIGKLKYGLTI